MLFLLKMPHNATDEKEVMLIILFMWNVEKWPLRLETYMPTDILIDNFQREIILIALKMNSEESLTKIPKKTLSLTKEEKLISN